MQSCSMTNLLVSADEADKISKEVYTNLVKAFQYLGDKNWVGLIACSWQQLRHWESAFESEGHCYFHKTLIVSIAYPFKPVVGKIVYTPESATQLWVRCSSHCKTGGCLLFFICRFLFPRAPLASPATSKPWLQVTSQVSLVKLLQLARMWLSTKHCPLQKLSRKPMDQDFERSKSQLICSASLLPATPKQVILFAIFSVALGVRGWLL